MRLVASGKVKDVYDAGGGLLRFHFSDRDSAYDVRFAEAIPKK
ncbi:MAG: phosphoribosylaminoimidazolesuccinocarboxamide synthase, partial [Thaumarchaeota archaeon S14]